MSMLSNRRQPSVVSGILLALAIETARCLALTGSTCAPRLPRSEPFYVRPHYNPVDCPYPQNQCPNDNKSAPSSLAVGPMYKRLKLGQVAATGWLGRQLILQSNGMSGWYQALFYPLVNRSAWVNNKGTITQPIQWVTYWTNGNVPLVGILGRGGPDQLNQIEHNLTSIIDNYIDFWITTQSNTTGQLGPLPCGWQFPVMNAIRSLMMYSDFNPTKKNIIDKAILASLQNLYQCTLDGKTSGGTRWPSHVEAIIDFLDDFPQSEQVEQALLNLSVTWRNSGVDWMSYYAKINYTTPFPRGPARPTHDGMPGAFHHGVNTNEGLKFAAVNHRLWGSMSDIREFTHAMQLLDTFHLHPEGSWGADEILAGRDPTRGTELCDIVEGMYSIEWTFRTLGDEVSTMLDRVELLAFNAFAGTTTADTWGHQYDHQTNAIFGGPGVICGGSNGGMATVFGLQPNYPCCTVNMPQGWPKLAMNAMLTSQSSQKLVINIVHLLPMNATFPSIGEVRVVTDYPWSDEVSIFISKSVPSDSLDATLRVRIPTWATNASITTIFNNTKRSFSVGSFAGKFWKCEISQFSSMQLDLNPDIRIVRGWGPLANPGPTFANYSANGTVIPTADPDDFALNFGATIVDHMCSNSLEKVCGLDIRSGNPGQTSTSTINHPLVSDGHALTGLTLSFQYIVGYSNAGNTTGLPNISIVLQDAMNGSHVATLWTSKPLGVYLHSYSHPVNASWVAHSGGEIYSNRCLQVAILVTNNDHNLQIPLSTLSLSVQWDPQSVVSHADMCSLSSPAMNAVAVYRGALLYALKLNEEQTTIRQPAAGGECESKVCHSRDIQINTTSKWNYALVLGPEGNLSGSFEFSQNGPSLQVPFSGALRSPTTIKVKARPLLTWEEDIYHKRTSTQPASPVKCSGEDARCLGDEETIELVPFGSTRIRIGAFPWITAESSARSE